MKTLNKTSLRLMAVCGLMLPLCGLAHVATAKQTTTGTATAPVVTWAFKTSALPTAPTLSGTSFARSNTPMLVVSVTGAYASGVRSVSVSGGFSGATGFYPGNTKSAGVNLYFYDSYFPAGSYTFVATVTGMDGKQTRATKTIITK